MIAFDTDFSLLHRVNRATAFNLFYERYMIVSNVLLYKFFASLFLAISDSVCSWCFINVKIKAEIKPIFFEWRAIENRETELQNILLATRKFKSENSIINDFFRNIIAISELIWKFVGLFSGCSRGSHRLDVLFMASRNLFTVCFARFWLSCWGLAVENPFCGVT